MNKLTITRCPTQDTDKSSQIVPLKNDNHRTFLLGQDCNCAHADVSRPHYL